MFLLAATFYVSIGIRGHELWVHGLIVFPEHRVPIPYRDIPFAAQPKTDKTLDVHVRMLLGAGPRSTAQRFDIHVGADSRALRGALSKAPKPR